MTSGAAVPTTRAALRVAARVWWTATRRRWRRETGVLLFLGAFGFALVHFTARIPGGGEALYVTTLFVLGLAVIVVLPAQFLVESPLTSRRWQLLPLPMSGLWLAQLLLGNPLRTVLALALLGWGAVALWLLPLPAWALVLGLVQLLGWTGAATVWAQMLEDRLRRSGSVALYQLVLIVGAGSWMPLLQLLRDTAAFVPGPEWAHGSLRPLLLGSYRGVAAEAAVAVLALGALAISLPAARALMAYHARTPPPPPPDARRGSAFARRLGRLLPRAPAAFARELATLPRFVFVRVDLVFVVLTTAVALGIGLPFGFLFIGFLWSSVLLNLLGPDAETGGTARYQLVGYPGGRVLRMRHLAIVVYTVLAAAATAVPVVLLGYAQPPTVGPGGYWAYPVFFGYGLSLLLLLTTFSDRYSVHFADRMEMRMLFPTRKHSGGAAAGLLALAVLGAAAVLAAAIFVGWLLALRAAGLGAGGAAVLPALGLAAATHLAVYLLRRRADERAP